MPTSAAAAAAQEGHVEGKGKASRQGGGVSVVVAVAGWQHGLWHLKQTHVFQIYTRIRLATNIIKRTAGEASSCYSCFAYFSLNSLYFPLLLLPLFELLVVSLFSFLCLHPAMSCQLFDLLAKV